MNGTKKQKAPRARKNGRRGFGKRSLYYCFTGAGVVLAGEDFAVFTVFLAALT